MMKNRQILIFLTIFMILGKVLLTTTLDFTLFNNSGKFINAKIRTITSPSFEPYDDATGRLYMAGDFGENNYSDNIQNDTIFTALKFNCIVFSESPIYSARIGRITHP